MAGAGTFHHNCPVRGLKPGPGTAFLRVGWMERCAGFLSFVPCPCDSPTPAGKARFVGRKHGEPTGCLRTSLSFAPSAPVMSHPGSRSHPVLHVTVPSLPVVPRLSSGLPLHRCICFPPQGFISISTQLPRVPSSCSATAMLLSLKDLMNQINKNNTILRSGN